MLKITQRSNAKYFYRIMSKHVNNAVFKHTISAFINVEASPHTSWIMSTDFFNIKLAMGKKKWNH